VSESIAERIGFLGISEHFCSESCERGIKRQPKTAEYSFDRIQIKLPFTIQDGPSGRTWTITSELPTTWELTLYPSIRPRSRPHPPPAVPFFSTMIADINHEIPAKTSPP